MSATFGADGVGAIALDDEREDAFAEVRVHHERCARTLRVCVLRRIACLHLHLVALPCQIKELQCFVL